MEEKLIGIDQVELFYYRRQGKKKKNLEVTGGAREKFSTEVAS